MTRWGRGGGRRRRRTTTTRGGEQAWSFAAYLKLKVHVLACQRVVKVQDDALAVQAYDLRCGSVDHLHSVAHVNVWCVGLHARGPGSENSVIAEESERTKLSTTTPAAVLTMGILRLRSSLGSPNASADVRRTLPRAPSVLARTAASNPAGATPSPTLKRIGSPSSCVCVCLCARERVSE